MEKKEMNWQTKKLREIEMQKKDMSDQYNQQQNPNMDRIEKLMQSSLKQISPRKHQTWLSYVTELKTHVDYADIKNERVHITNNGKASWYTHRIPSGCFMCEDVNMRHVMLTIMEYMANQYPNNIF